jgi:hypothetical protein
LRLELFTLLSNLIRETRAASCGGSDSRPELKSVRLAK